MEERESKTINRIKKPFLVLMLCTGGAFLLNFYLDLPTNTVDHYTLFLKSLIPDLIATIVVALLVTLILEGLTNYEKKKEKTELLNDITRELTSFLSKAAKSEKEGFKKELLIGVQNISKGLGMNRASEVFEMASRYIADCKEIRVIGTVNRNQAQNDFESPGVRKCVDATEKRIQDDAGLSYRRITALNLNPYFKKHLENCFDAKGVRNKLQLIFIEDFSPAYSYLIIDRKFLMVSLTYEEPAAQQICLFTETNNYQLIDEFIRHFEALWVAETSEERKNIIITNRTDFDNIYKIQSEAEKYFKELKRRINQLHPKSTLFQKQALKDLELFSKNFNYEDESNIRHSTANENLIRIFINYLSFLESEDVYRTITFCSFWSNIIAKKDLLDDFVNANDSALTKNVLIERLLVIDKTLLIDRQPDDAKAANYTKTLKTIISENVELMEKHSAYKFRILFTDEHDEYERDLYNFAIITSKKNGEKIIFKPIRQADEIPSTNISKNSTELMRDENRYNDLTKLWERQTLSHENAALIKSLDFGQPIVSRLFKKRINDL